MNAHYEHPDGMPPPDDDVPAGPPAPQRNARGRRTAAGGQRPTAHQQETAANLQADLTGNAPNGQAAPTTMEDIVAGMDNNPPPLDPEAESVYALLNPNQRKWSARDVVLPEDDFDARTATHSDIANRIALWCSLRFSAQPVYAEGRFWFVNVATHIWEPVTTGQFASMVGNLTGQRRDGVVFPKCTKLSDYTSITKILLDRLEVVDFFEQSTPGVVAENGFHTIEEGMINVRAVRTEDRVRHVIKSKVDPNCPAPLFKQFLDDCFTVPPEIEPDPDRAAAYKLEQEEHLQELIGLALIGQLSKHQVAVLFYGPAQTGKSQMLHIIEAMFQDHETAASNPATWDKEYYVADLAGKRLNIVGEFGIDKPVPIEFKAVVGGDRITGRHPTHRPFSFVCQAAHFFNANHFPPSRDKSRAFFRRWRIVHFANSRPDETKIPDLHKPIIKDELPYVLAWALEGARRVANSNKIRETTAHRRLLEQWSMQINSVLQFFADPEECKLTTYTGKEERCLVSEAYPRYASWCIANNLKPLSPQTFNITVKETGSLLGVTMIQNAKKAYVLVGVGSASPPIGPHRADEDWR